MRGLSADCFCVIRKWNCVRYSPGRDFPAAFRTGETAIRSWNDAYGSGRTGWKGKAISWRCCAKREKSRTDRRKIRRTPEAADGKSWRGFWIALQTGVSGSIWKCVVKRYIRFLILAGKFEG